MATKSSLTLVAVFALVSMKKMPLSLAYDSASSGSTLRFEFRSDLLQALLQGTADHHGAGRGDADQQHSSTPQLHQPPLSFAGIVWRSQWRGCSPAGTMVNRWERFRSALAQMPPWQLQRRRAAVAVGLGLLSWLLRPWPPMVWLPGWVVGGLLLWGAIELWLLAWRPQRWR